MTNELTASQQYWSNKLEEADQSGIRLAEYARLHSIPAQKLYQWRSTLKQKNTRVTEETRFTRVVTESSVANPSLTVSLKRVTLEFASLPDPRWLATMMISCDTDL